MSLFKQSLLFILILSSFSFFVSCSSATKQDVKYAKKLRIESGKTIFNGKGNCASCHDVSQTLVGPSLQVISSVYNKKGNMIAFFKQKEGAIVVPGQSDGMKPNFGILSKMSEEELLSLEAYILSIK